MAEPNSNSTPKKQLTVFDSVCIMVGIIIGVGIYQTSPTIAGCMPSSLAVLSMWAIGGLFSLAGALCYAELATAYPYQGGDYVYLNRAYGSWAGFLFAWADLLIIRPGSIALMAFPFAAYAQTLYSPFMNHPLEPYTQVIYATIAVVALASINIIGVRQGKWTQNILTMGKVAGVLAIFTVALFAPDQPRPPASEPGGALTLSGINLALILVLFSYGGWNEIAYVAAEVKNPNRNIVRSLVFATAAVTLLYIMINGAFLHTLGHAKMSASEAVATDTVAAVFPGLASRMISALICVSALGAVNGMIFAGARIAYAVGQEHRPFRILGKWSSQFGTPVWALVFLGCLSIIIILLSQSFNKAVFYTSAVVWAFFLATGVSVFILRKKEPHLPRPYKVTGHPFTTLLFCASCLFLIYSAAAYDYKVNHFVGTCVAVSILFIGLLFFLLSRKIASAKGSSNR